MAIKSNRIGLELLPYRGGKTTLCAGCGHNAISERIIDAFFEMGVEPSQVIKLSGIGCSSKSRAYFLGGAQVFESLRGLMPLERIGVVLADRVDIALGLSVGGYSVTFSVGELVRVSR